MGTTVFDQDRALGFDRVAKTTFAPIYPVIAGQILEKTGITEGRCVDVGSGPGSLAIAIARISDLALWSLDLSPAMSTIARENICNAELQDRIITLTGDVQSLPFPDGTLDLVVSRGSMFFWENKAAAFSEISRILRPGGWAYMGGGFGTPELAAAIAAERRDNDKQGPPGDHNPDNYHNALAQAGIQQYNLRRDGSGFWITVRKPMQATTSD